MSARSHLTVNGTPYCEWTGMHWAMEKLKTAPLEVRSIQCGQGDQELAGAEVEKLKEFFPGFSVKVVKSPCPAYQTAEIRRQAAHSNQT